MASTSDPKYPRLNTLQGNESLFGSTVDGKNHNFSPNAIAQYALKPQEPATVTVASQYQSPGIVCKQIGSLVYVSGNLTRATPPAQIETLFTLPEGHRPLRTVDEGVNGYITGVGFAPIRLRYLTSGNVELHHFGNYPDLTIYIHTLFEVAP
jgi:hypothetical protein